MPFQLKSDLIHKFWFLCLLILFVINSALIVGFQVWFVYNIDTPVTEKTILAMDKYTNCTVSDHAQGSILQSWLLKTSSGDTHIVTLEKHPFTEQYRIVKSGTTLIAASETMYEDSVTADSARVVLTVTNHESITGYMETELNFTLRFGRSASNGLRIPAVYALYSFLLLVIEILGYALIKKLRK